VQFDWGGEYEKLNSFFKQIGIEHHVSCPYAHQQNGSVERKHRHIIEVGLALLANASMPLKFWDEAFLTATYLINMLPSKVINHETPIEHLLHKTPDYASLRTFGCACWPNLRPFNTRKLAFRSTQCVFLGYSPMHTGVKCLDVKTGRVYISRDVVFDETVFPFASLHPNAGALLRQEILLLPESLHPHPASSQGGEKHCTDLTPNDSIIHVSNNSTQVQQHAGENCTQIGEETWSNEAGVYHRMIGARHEANQPRIGETPRSLGESTPGSTHASEETAFRRSVVPRVRQILVVRGIRCGTRCGAKRIRLRHVAELNSQNSACVTRPIR
jgi:hypothetical protein